MIKWAKPTEKIDLTVDDYEKIIHEVLDLLAVSEVFDILAGSDHNTTGLDNRLRELLNEVTVHPTDELIAYLRFSFAWRHNLSTWQMLLNATVKQALERNSNEWVQEAFGGMIQYTSYGK